MNKSRLFSRIASSAGVVAVAGIAWMATSSSPASAQSGQTQEKIRLMTEALQAQDAGNYLLARERLDELNRLFPDNPDVQRQLERVETQLKRQASGQPMLVSANVTAAQSSTQFTFPPRGANASAPAPSTARSSSMAPSSAPSAQPASGFTFPPREARPAPEPAMMPQTQASPAANQAPTSFSSAPAASAPQGPLPVYQSPPSSSVAQPAAPTGMNGAGADLLAQESAELDKKIQEAQQTLQEAEVLVENDREQEALASLAEAKAELPLSSSTVFVIDEISAAQARIYRRQIEMSLAEDDLEAAEAVLGRYEGAIGRDESYEMLAAEVNALAQNPFRQRPERLSPDYVRKVAQIDDMIVKARAMMAYGDLEGASGILRRAEAIDPTNPTVKGLLLKISQIYRDTEWLDYSKTREQMLEEVGRQWQRPTIFEFRGQEGDDPVMDPTMEKLQSIEIPQIEISNQPLSRVIDTLSELSVEYDDTADDPANRGVNMITRLAGENDPTVNIRLRFLTLDKVLDLVTDSVGYSWDIDNGVVVISQGADIGADGLLENEIFTIPPSALPRITGRFDTGGGGGGAAVVDDPFAPAPAAPTGGGGSTAEDQQAIKEFLQSAGVDFRNVQGADLAFDGTRIFVSQTPRNIQRIRQILRRYSETEKQVEIESKFLEVEQGSLDELGFNYTLATDNVMLNTATGTVAFGSNDGVGAFSGNRSLANTFTADTANSSSLSIASPGAEIVDPVTGVTTNVIDPLNIDLPLVPPSLPNAIDIGASGGTTVSALGIIDDVQLGVMINALSRQTGSDLLSSPRVTVMNGNTARIVVAQELIYPESYGDVEAEVDDGGGTITGGGGSASVAVTAGTPQDFTVRNVGVEMEVTPDVLENDNIKLRLNPKVTEFEGFVEYGGPSVAIAGSTVVTVPSGFFQPIFSVREVETTVTVFDGATVVLGGLTREEIVTVDDSVPVLGDIPLLGRLFQSKGESSQKLNLLIFVTANLISPGGSPSTQRLGDIEQNSRFQNPILVTPGGGVSREANPDEES